MTERALMAMLAHLEAKQMASDFLLEVLFGSYLSHLPETERDEQLAKVAMLARERTSFSASTSAEDKQWLETLMPDFVDHVERLCRRISARSDDTGAANE